MVHTHATAAGAGPVASPQRTRQPRRPRWPLLMAAAGLAGLLATALTAPPPYGVGDGTVDPAGAALAFTAASLLVVTAACWRRLVEPRTRSSTAAHVVPLAMTVSAAGLALGGATGGAWAGVAVAAAAVTWMGVRERTVSRPVAVVSALALAAMAVEPLVAAPSWLLLTGLALAFGRSTIGR